MPENQARPLKPRKVDFVENKLPELLRVSRLLELCASTNSWANRGPLYQHLAEIYEHYFAIDAHAKVVPCANAGIALEALARLHEVLHGRKLQWVGCAFSFANLARGYFADMQLVDCLGNCGLLDLLALEKLDPQSYDGIVVTNPFGLVSDLSDYIEYANKHDKQLLIDNAAGIVEGIPNWPWQVFSLHQTKPFGFGEGGLAVVPKELADAYYDLLNYGSVPDTASIWLNNGKLSDVACAFHIARFETRTSWLPQYREQAQRIIALASQVGFRCMLSPSGELAATSYAFEAPCPVTPENLSQTEAFTSGKYYKPLAEYINTVSVYDKIINIPTHPDMHRIRDKDVKESLQRVLDRAEVDDKRLRHRI